MKRTAPVYGSSLKAAWFKARERISLQNLHINSALRPELQLPSVINSESSFNSRHLYPINYIYDTSFIVILSKE